MHFTNSQKTIYLLLFIHNNKVRVIYKNKQDANIFFKKVDLIVSVFRKSTDNKVKWCYCKQIINVKGGYIGNVNRHYRIKYDYMLIHRSEKAIVISQFVLQCLHMLCHRPEKKMWLLETILYVHEEYSQPPASKTSEQT